jgi:uncharacterized membrane protein YoaK (UPF0700 family)
MSPCTTVLDREVRRVPYPLGAAPATSRAAPIGPIAGGGMLAFLAGFVNASLLSFYHVPVSHMSGAATQLGLDVGAGRNSELTTLALIMGAFFCGAVTSGCLIGRTSLRPGKRYSVVLLLEAVTLVGAGLLLAHQQRGCLYAAAYACGMQNAMASSYYGLVIRTTHLTGIVTDLGVQIGHVLRHRRFDRWKFSMLGAILVGFILGAVSSALLGRAYAMNQLYLAAGLTGSISLGYLAWLRRFPQRP